MYKALTYINLPPDNRKAPGDRISEAELKEAGQTEENVEQLLKGKAMSKDMEAKIDKAHDPIVIPPSDNPLSIDVVAGEVAYGGDSNN